jgi:hypothetical protein
LTQVGGLGPPLPGDSQVFGVGNPPDGTTTKSWQTHIFWQQKGPLVVGMVQTKPLLHLVPGSESEQSSSDEQLDVHIGPSDSAAVPVTPWGVGSRQIRLGH